MSHFKINLVFSSNVATYHSPFSLITSSTTKTNSHQLHNHCTFVGVQQNLKRIEGNHGFQNCNPNRRIVRSYDLTRPKQYGSFTFNSRSRIDRIVWSYAILVFGHLYGLIEAYLGPNEKERDIHLVFLLLLWIYEKKERNFLQDKGYNQKPNPQVHNNDTYVFKRESLHVVALNIWEERETNFTRQRV